MRQPHWIKLLIITEKDSVAGGESFELSVEKRRKKFYGGSQSARLAGGEAFELSVENHQEKSSTEVRIRSGGERSPPRTRLFMQFPGIRENNRENTRFSPEKTYLRSD